MVKSNNSCSVDFLRAAFLELIVLIFVRMLSDYLYFSYHKDFILGQFIGYYNTMFSVKTFNFNLLNVTPEVELLLRTLRRNLLKQGITINLGIYSLVFSAKLRFKFLFVGLFSNIFSLACSIFITFCNILVLCQKILDNFGKHDKFLSYYQQFIVHCIIP